MLCDESPRATTFGEHWMSVELEGVPDPVPRIKFDYHVIDALKISQCHRLRAARCATAGSIR